MVDLAVDYESLRFIELRGDDSKLPAKKWGGYSQDFDAAEHVYTHDEIVAMDCEEWGVVDCAPPSDKSQALLIFDLDSYKAPDDFDVNRLTVPDNTLITKSQSGGNHVYFLVDCERGELNESDFEVTDNLPFDIDIRGSAVSHHVVAPADIPGADGSYEIVNDEPISSEFGPREACSNIKLDGEPAIEFDAGTNTDIDFDRPDEAPEGMPTCYHAGLSLRREAPDDGVNTHKVNVYTALCGLAAGFDAEAVASHMCGEFAPMDGDTDVNDKEKTQYQVTHLKEQLDGGYSPPALSSLHEHGILDAGEECGADCPIGMHHTRSKAEWAALKTVEEFIDEFDKVDDRPEEPDLDDADVDPTDPDVQAALDAWPDDDNKDDIADAVTTLTERDYKEHVAELVDRVWLDRERMDLHRSLAHQLQDVKGNIITYDGKLVTVRTGRWFSLNKTIFNFELEVTSRLSVEGEGRMANVEVRPAEPNDSKFELQIEPSVFNDVHRFKDEVLSERFSTTIETSMRDSAVMDMVRKHISRQDVPDLTGQKQMGLSGTGDEIVTPNGTIDEDGWVDEPDTIHVERDVGGERKFVADPDEHDVGEIDNDDVARMIELFTRTRDSERFLPVLGWMYAAPFRRAIVDRTGEFNLLHVNGESGVGKTGTLGIASRMVGMSAEPFSCTDTTFATITTLASSRGVPIWLDEYKISEMPDWQQNKLHELLRKAATGGVEQRGNSDQTTEEYHLRAPVVVSGETSIRGSAEQRRSISVTFTNRPTRSDTEEFHRFKELAGDAVTDDDGSVSFPDARYDLEEHAVKYYSHVAGTTSEEFEQAWFSAREYVSHRLAEWGVELDDMEVQGLQTVVFGYKMLRSFGEEVGADLMKLPDQNELDNALRYIADIEGDGRETHTDQFLLLVQRATAAGELEEGTHWTVVKAGKPGEELRVNVTRAFDAVSKYCRDHDLSEDLLGSARDYKSRYSEAVEQDTYVTTTSQNTPPISRCVGIDTSRAEEELAEFDRAVFTGSVEDDDGGEGVNDDGDDCDGPMALTDLTGDEDYVTVTVEVVDWSAMPEKVLEAGGPVESGSVKDSSGRRDVVVFDYDDETAPEGIEHMLDDGALVRIKNAAVSDYMDSPQLVLDAGTEIERVQQGVGNIPVAESPEGQETVNDADSGDESSEDDSVGAGRRDGGQDGVRADGGSSTVSVSAVAEAAVTRVVGRHPGDDSVTRTAVWDCFRATTDTMNGGEA